MTGSETWRGALLAAALVACGGGGDPGAGHSSSTLARSGDDVFAVNVDEGTVSRIGRSGDVVTSAVLGREPTRIAAAGGHLFVTLRADGELVVLNERDLSVERRVQVGAEPYGVVTTSDGALAYVAVSLGDEVLEVDTATGKVLRSFALEHEPRWLALNQAETVLFATHARNGGRVSRIDLESGRVTTREPPPVGGDHPSGEGGVDPGMVPGEFTPRSTGDLVISPDGTTLAVPTLYVDNLTPVTSSEGGSSTGGYGGDTGVGLGRINPALVTYPIDGRGELGVGRAVFLGVAPGGRFGSGGRETFRSYPNAVAAAPDGRYFAVSMEGSDAVVVVDSEPFAGQPDDRPERDEGGSFSVVPASHFGFWDRPVSMVMTEGAGPRGLAFVGSDLVVHTFLDRRVETVPWSDAIAANRHEANDRRGAANPLRIRSRSLVRELVPSVLSPEQDRGRRLFLSATERDMASRSGGISCGTCHFDGREDGLTWTFAEDGTVVHLQTPSLAGPVNDTAPLTWRSPIDSVATEALLTTTLRMGGRGPSAEDLLAIEAFVVNSRMPVLPAVDTELVAEGAALFAREDVGCASCHSGERLTDGRHHRVLGELEANTPGLRGVAASPPYLHDGSAKTLRDVLVWARSGEMGDTSMLDDHQLDALEAYLRSL